MFTEKHQCWNLFIIKLQEMYLEHVRDVSRTQSRIKMEPIVKIVNGSRGVLEQNGRSYMQLFV